MTTREVGRTIFSVFVILLLIASLSYIAFTKCRDYSQSRYEQGYMDGSNETQVAINQILLKQAATCQAIPLKYSDGTQLNLIAQECFTQNG